MEDIESVTGGVGGAEAEEGDQLNPVLTVRIRKLGEKTENRDFNCISSGMIK